MDSETVLVLVKPDLWERIRSQLEYTASGFHEAQQTSSHGNGTRDVTFRSCFNETCRENTQLLADMEDDEED